MPPVVVMLFVYIIRILSDDVVVEIAVISKGSSVGWESEGKEIER